MRSPLYLLPKESATAIFKVLVLSILHWMLIDPKMHACSNHVISAKDVIYPGLTGCNASRWCLANLAYDGGLSWRLISNLEWCSGETIPLHLIQQGSAVDTTQILAILIITTEMAYTWSCTERQLHINLNMGGTSSYPDMSIASLVHIHHEFGMGTCRWATNWRKFKNYITIKDWRKVVHLQMLDIIIINLLEGIPKTLSSTESLQTVHNATLWTGDKDEELSNLCKQETH
jgi:hypothetical protein